MRTIFIGDIHGCCSELIELSALLAIGKKDRVICLGDLCGKGPECEEAVRFAYQSGYESLLGNHDLYYLSRCRRGEQQALSMRRRMGAAAARWLEESPAFIEEEKFIAVHAGLRPDLPLQETPTEVLTQIRFWHGRPWYEFYQGERPVFYGHWAAMGLNLRKNTFGLDSGCVYGSRLSAMILETGEVVSVAAKERYCGIGS